MDKSGVQRILATLLEANYLERLESGKYQLSLSLWELGTHIAERFEPRRLVHPILRYGAKTSGFTVFLAMNSYPFVVYLDKVEGSHGRSHSAEPGRRIPMSRTAAGRAILAYLPQADIAELAEPHSHWGGQSRFEPILLETLRAQLDVARKARFAVSEGGLQPGVNSVAAPIWWRDTRPFGSIVITGDEQNLPKTQFAELGNFVKELAKEATASLGGLKWQQDCEQQLIHDV